jgi:cell division protein FtsB
MLRHKAKLRIDPPKATSMSHLNSCDIQLIQLRSELKNLRDENAKLIAEMKKLSTD